MLTTGSGRPRRRPGLTRDRIAHAALALIDRDGLGALSMRRLGAELRVDPMSLYNHVSSKADLLDAVQVLVLADLGIDVGDPTDLRGYLLEVGRAYRRVGLGHPEALPIVFARAITAPESLRPVESILETLDRAGCPPDAAFAAFPVLFGFLNGYLLTEAANRPDLAAGRPVDDPPVDSGAAYRELGADEFARLRETGEIIAGLDPDEMFETSLGIVLDGLVRFLDQRRTPPTRSGRP